MNPWVGADFPVTLNHLHSLFPALETQSCLLFRTSILSTVQCFPPTSSWAGETVGSRLLRGQRRGVSPFLRAFLLFSLLQGAGQQEGGVEEAGISLPHQSCVRAGRCARPGFLRDSAVLQPGLLQGEERPSRGQQSPVMPPWSTSHSGLGILLSSSAAVLEPLVPVPLLTTGSFMFNHRNRWGPVMSSLSWAELE